jgi:long-subunit fatty acid transport protein
MCFSERRARAGRRHAGPHPGPGAVGAACRVGFAAALALLAAGGRAAAAPLDEPFVGGLSFTGPTAGNLGAVYWNPAALGLVRGFQLMVAGAGRLSTVDVDRAPINPDTGAPGGTQPTGSAQARDLTWPQTLGPQSMFALSTDFGGDRFTIAFATYMPYLQRITFPLSPAMDEPTRYQTLALDLRNLVLAPALSIRFGDDLRIGVAPGFLFSTGRVSFAQDLGGDCGGVACGVENPSAAARYDVMSGHGFGDAKFAVTLGAGIYYRRRWLEIGVAYQSRPFGGDVDGVEVAGQRTTVTLPPRDPMGGGMLLTCPLGQIPPAGHSDRCVFGDVAYKLPDVWIGGATWRLGQGLELSAMVRWIWLSVHDRIDIRLSGPTLDANGHDLPQHIVLHRGFQDVWDTRLRVSYWWRERIRVGAMMRFETSAVQNGSVNAAAVDGFKIQPVGLIEVRILKQLWLGGGYGVTFMRTVDVANSAFKPEYARDCAASGNNLATEACQQQLAGRARPTAAGQYAARTHDFGLTMTLKF